MLVPFLNGVLAQCGPQISLTNTLVVFALGNANVTRTFPLNATSTCSARQANCSITLSDPSIAVSGLSVTLPPSQATGTYSVLFNCSAESSINTLNSTFYIVNPTYLQRVQQTVIRRIPDCVPSIVDLASLSFNFNGGVTASMIRITPSLSAAGDAMNTTSLSPGMPSGSFSQQAIADGQVSIYPVSLDTISASRLATLTIVALDPAANIVTTNVKFTIYYGYCPIAPATGSLVSGSGTPAVITTSVLALTETHGMSVWDVEWRTPSLSNGRFEYYCPDSLCGGPGWVTFSGSTFPHSWVIMNAIRWNPNGYNGQNFNVTFLTSNNFDSAPSGVSVIVTFSISGPGTNVPLPYSSNSISGCTWLKATSSGVQTTTNLPTGFTSASPIRPMCGSVSTGPIATDYGDLILQTGATASVFVSTGISIDPSLSFPAGFTPLTFTGKKSQQGSLSNGLLVSMTPSTSVPITITLPQVTYPTDPGIQLATDLSVLKYDNGTGQMYYLPMNQWSRTGGGKLVPATVVYSSGIYFFGKFNATLASNLTILPSTYVYMQPSAGTLSFNTIGSQVSMQINVTKETSFAVMPATGYVPNPDGYKIQLRSYLTTLSAVDAINRNITVTLSAICNYKDCIWAYFG
ncbi:hypothetical protein EDD86DRAFT_203859 [Gorgonomyces haynaldii]|nr:hypothetical protein EDD86DRAFT_203859 [Gorgonomyces haynaldii]